MVCRPLHFIIVGQWPRQIGWTPDTKYGSVTNACMLRWKMIVFNLRPTQPPTTILLAANELKEVKRNIFNY